MSTQMPESIGIMKYELERASREYKDLRSEAATTQQEVALVARRLVMLADMLALDGIQCELPHGLFSVGCVQK